MKDINVIRILIVFISCLFLSSSAIGLTKYKNKESTVGIYLYENIEGYHTVSSVAGTEIANALLPIFKRVTTNNKVPLESNESVRILSDMTKNRKVVIAALNTWIAGNIISAPTVTFADDAIKFRDLTWHVDENAINKSAKKIGLDMVISGSFTGLVRQSTAAERIHSDKLSSVSVIANLKLMNVTDQGVIWTKTYNEVVAGFDPRVAFNEAVLNISKKAATELKSFFKKT